MAAASSHRSALPGAPVKEGEVLDAKYRIEKVIGQGGMGIVVSAMNLEVNERVALKFLLPQAQASDELIGRFMREAKASVKLKGKHVAKTHDVGALADGRAYIVMEYLDGKDLGAEIKAANGTPFPIEDVVSWVLQACEGLAEAHALGIVHRDLKPANLFLSRVGDKRTVKVLDFGISKSINPTSSDMLSLTKTEMLLGSPLYMAPEQMRSSKYVDERSDVWSLGAVAYELLTGHVPFEADTLLDLCFKVAQESCIPAKEHRPELPQGLSDAVMRCLEKEAIGRFSNVGEVATAIEPFARPSERGGAQRTVDVLAAADPKLRARAESLAPESPPVSPLASTGPQKKRPVTTGSAPIERAPDPIEDDGRADNIPPSSAWGATQAEPIPQSRSWKGPLGIALLGVVVASISFMLARASNHEAAPPPPPPPIVEPVKPPEVTPPTVTVTATATVPSATMSAAASAVPTPPVTAKPARTKPATSSSAAPTDSSGFFKFRE